MSNTKNLSPVDAVKKSPVVSLLREGRGVLYSAANGFPAHQLTVIGVTGTDGKTTTCNLIYHILKSTGKKVGIISTIGFSYFNGETEINAETGLHVTSPDSADIHKYLREMSNNGCEYAVLECTSHALDQSRFAGITIDVGVVTNITHEHLDYHKTYNKYLMAKAILFKRDLPFYHRAPQLSVAVLNEDDKSWELLKPYLDGWNVVGYGTSDFSKLRAADIKNTTEGLEFVVIVQDDSGQPLNTYEIKIPLYGAYNAHNILAAIGAAHAIGVDYSEIAVSLSSFAPVPGRFEKFTTKSHGLVVVDFAHTPNALHQLLLLAKELVSGRVITVFGSAGLRDTEKRPLMGEISSRFSDISIITSEDPRTESVETISREIAVGLERGGAEEFPHESLRELDDSNKRKALEEHYPLYMYVSDRKKAIFTAIALASPDDIVLICGKGHEKSMCFGETEVPWSDQSVVSEALSFLES